MFNIDLSYSSVKSAPTFFYPFILMKLFRRNTGRDLNLLFPCSFGEKIQYLKLFDNKKIKTQLTDKIEVLNHIASVIEKKHIKKMFGIYNSISDIDLNTLPETFYLKTNHGCKWQLKIDSKDYFIQNYDEINRKFSSWLRINYAYANGLELQYKNIEPKIFVEEVVSHPDYMFPVDVEFFCFDGRPRITSIRAIKDEFYFGLTLYNENKEVLPYRFNSQTYECKINPVPLPNFYDDMFEIAKKLSKGFKMVRIDFFYTGDNFYFAEMTFTPFSGYCSPDIELEKMISNWFRV